MLDVFRPDFAVAAGQQVSLIWYVPRMQGPSVQLGGSQLFHLLGADPGGGYKKRLGAFRPAFPVAAGQQVSLIRYSRM